MLDGGFGDLQILDSTRYRQLYITKVYEKQTTEKLDEDQLNQCDTILIHSAGELPSLEGLNDHILEVDRIGLTQIH